LTTCTSCLSNYPYFFSADNSCYEVCPDGFYGSATTNTCQSCSNDCTTCLGTADTCTSCSTLTSKPFLYQDKCHASCPPGSYLTSPNICSSCSTNCATCSGSADYCTSCSENLPYLSGSHCVATPPQLSKTTKSFSVATNAGFTLGAALGSTGAMAIFTGVLFKLIGYIKYLEIAYPLNLEQTLETWQTDLIPSAFPEMSQSTQKRLRSKPIPHIFVKREVASTFLENFWFSLWNLAASLVAFTGVFLAILYCEHNDKKTGKIYSALKCFKTALVNFTITQLYFNFGDIILFFVLQMRSIDFGSILSDLSFCLSIVFLITAVCVLIFHFFVLFKYKKASTDNSQKGGTTATNLQRFEQNYELFKILYDSFKGSSFFPSSYLLVFTLRDVALNFVIALLFEHPLVQIILFICICVLFMSYLIILKPFKEKSENYEQYFFESIVLLTYFFALLIKCADSWENQNAIKHRLGLGIIVMALIFSLFSTVLMIIGLARTALEMYKDLKAWLAQRKGLRKVHIDLSTQNTDFSTKTEIENSIQETLDNSPTRSSRQQRSSIHKISSQTENQVIMPNSHNTSTEELIKMKLYNSNLRRKGNYFLRNNNRIFEKPELSSNIVNTQDETQATSRPLITQKPKTDSIIFESPLRIPKPTLKKSSNIYSQSNIPVFNIGYSQQNVPRFKNQKNQL